MLYEEWKSRYKNLKNFNTVLQRCPRFWPLAPPRGMNPGVYSLGISEDPPRYLSSKFDASVRSDCWDISIWKTLTQCDGNGNANANVDDRGDYNSSPCTSYRRAKNLLSKQFSLHNYLVVTHASNNRNNFFQASSSCGTSGIRNNFIKMYSTEGIYYTPSMQHFFFFFFFLIWVLQPFQEYFTYIEPIVHRRWVKTGVPREKPPDHP